MARKSRLKQPAGCRCAGGHAGRCPRMTGDPGIRTRMRSGAGFTLLELVIAVGVLGILAVLAQGQFAGYIDRARVGAARADIAMLSLEILRYQNVNDGRLPASLADVGRGDMHDPWERPYHYVDLTGKSRGKARKDRRLNPINSDYDLFSAGKNGVYKPQVSQKDSLDDVIRARDGGYIGLAKDF